MGNATRSRRAGWMLLGSLLACSEAVAPPLPPNAVPLEPLAVYRTWWNLVEQCSGLRRSFDDVHWYVAPRVDLKDPTVAAAWTRDGQGDRIVLGASAFLDGRVVRHEMLHALYGEPGHPRALFAEACAQLVSCEHGCAPPEASRGVPSTAREVLPQELQVSVRLEPVPPSAQVDSGWFRVIVTAANPLSEAVWVPVLGDIAFGFREEVFVPNDHPVHQGHGIVRSVPAVEPRWAFRAGEARSAAFDIRWPAGGYFIGVSFGPNERSPISIRVEP